MQLVTGIRLVLGARSFTAASAPAMAISSAEPPRRATVRVGVRFRVRVRVRCRAQVIAITSVDPKPYIKDLGSEIGEDLVLTWTRATPAAKNQGQEQG